MAPGRPLSFYFTVGIIVFFVISLFGVVLSVPSQQGGQATPSPAPAQRFKGVGQGRPTVQDLGSRFLIQCKAVSADAVAALEKLEAVQTVFKASTDVVVLLANASRAAELDAAGGALLAQDIQATLAAGCPDVRVLRAGVLSFTEPLKLAATPDSEAKGERTLFPKELTAHGLRTSGVPGVVAYVDGPTAAKNASITVFVSATLSGTQIEELVAEQALFEIGVPTTTSIPSPSPAATGSAIVTASISSPSPSPTTDAVSPSPTASSTSPTTTSIPSPSPTTGAVSPSPTVTLIASPTP